MQFINVRKFLMVILYLGGLSGCSMPLSMQDRQSIHTFQLNAMNAPNGPTIETHGQDAGRQITIIGAIAADIVEGGREQTLSQEMKNNHIDIKDLVVNEFTKQLTQKTNWTLVQNNADAKLSIQINDYGFRPGIGLSTIVPYIMLEASLTKNQRVVWRNVAGSDLGFLKGPTYKLSDLNQNPDLVRNAFMAVSQDAIKKILKNT